MANGAGLWAMDLTVGSSRSTCGASIPTRRSNRRGGVGFNSILESLHPRKPDKRKVPKRRHRAALNDAHAVAARRPGDETRPAEFRLPAETTGERRQPALERCA